MFFLLFETNNPENFEIVSAEEIEKAVETFSISFLQNYKYTVKYPYVVEVTAIKLKSKEKMKDFKVTFCKTNQKPILSEK